MYLSQILGPSLALKCSIHMFCSCDGPAGCKQKPREAHCTELLLYRIDILVFFVFLLFLAGLKHKDICEWTSVHGLRRPWLSLWLGHFQAILGWPHYPFKLHFLQLRNRLCASPGGPAWRWWCFHTWCGFANWLAICIIIIIIRLSSGLPAYSRHVFTHLFNHKFKTGKLSNKERNCSIGSVPTQRTFWALTAWSS